MERIFSKEGIGILKRQMKNFSGSLAIRKMQIKVMVRFHVISTIETIIYELKIIINAVEYMEKKIPYYTIGGDINQHNHYERQHVDYSKF